MKQTAVQEMINIVQMDMNNGVEISMDVFMGMLKQAKEMEKQQRNHYVELSKWIIKNKRSVFEEADISIESKRKILNELGYSSGDY